VNTWERHKVGLEFIQIHIESTIKPKAGGDRADNLGNQAVKVLKAGARNIQVPAANIIDSLVINEERAVGVLNRAVGGQDSVVRLHDSGGNTGRRIHCELQLGLLAVFCGQTFEKKSAETGASAAAKRVEDQKSLKRAAVVW
jgi:hypothetical protein